KVVAGKVMAHIPPYAIVLQRHRFPAEELVALHAAAIAAKRPYVASHSLEESALEKIKSSISTILSCVADELELRSIRRGAIQTMAQMGVPLSEIVLLSQHRSQDMLLRYLNHGTVSSVQTKTIAAVTSAMGDLINSAPTPI